MEAVPTPAAESFDAPSPSGPTPVVCILGNAQTVQMAREMSAVWPGFHAFWAVWGEDAESVTAAQASPGRDRLWASHGALSPGGASLFFPFPCRKGACPWKVGMEAALAHARASGAPCEYYFTSDDDSAWSLSDGSNGTATPLAGGTPQAELSAILRVCALPSSLIAFSPLSCGLRVPPCVQLCACESIGCGRAAVPRAALYVCVWVYVRRGGQRWHPLVGSMAIALSPALRHACRPGVDLSWPPSPHTTTAMRCTMPV